MVSVGESYHLKLATCKMLHMHTFASSASWQGAATRAAHVTCYSHKPTGRVQKSTTDESNFYLWVRFHTAERHAALASRVGAGRACVCHLV